MTTVTASIDTKANIVDIDYNNSPVEGMLMMDLLL